MCQGMGHILAMHITIACVQQLNMRHKHCPNDVESSKHFSLKISAVFST